MSGIPVLSICIPTFNRASVLDRSLAFHLSRFDALGLDFEIVVADDGSTDDTDAVIARYAADKRLRFIRRRRNSGFLDNYAFVMRASRGEFAVFLGDDDLLIPEKVLEYVMRMRMDPGIGMFQAPWMCVDDRPGRGPMGPFYRIPGQFRFAANDFAGLLDFIFAYHVFPEFYIIRAEILRKAISRTPAFIFWPFLYVARALKMADIVFDPEPFVNVTAVSNNPNLQQGNKETMREWDRYRGGLEYLAAQIAMNEPDMFPKRLVILARIQEFMVNRLRVALRLLVGDKQWADAYILHQRLQAYGQSAIAVGDEATIGIAAAFTMCVEDIVGMSAGPILADPAISDNVIDLLKPDLKARIHRIPPATVTEAPIHIGFDDGYIARQAGNAHVVDLRDYLAQFGGA